MLSGSGDTSTKNIFVRTGITIIQWAVVIWLLLPLTRPFTGSEDFFRVAGGIFLFVVFATKLLYDTIIVGRTTKRETVEQIWHIVGIILSIVLIVAMVVVFIGLLMANIIKSSMSPV